MNGQRFCRNFIIILFVLAVVSALVWFQQHWDLRNIQATLASYGPFAPLLFILIYAITTMCFIPSTPFTVAGGLLFGPIMGVVVNVCGALLGSSLAFLLARYFARDWVARKAGSRLHAVFMAIEKEGWRFVAVTRLIPMIPYTFLNYSLGLTKLRFLSFFLTSALFMLPHAIAYTYLGSLGETFIYGNTREIITDVTIALSLLLLLACLPWILKQYQNHSMMKAIGQKKLCDRPLK